MPLVSYPRFVPPIWTDKKGMFSLKIATDTKYRVMAARRSEKGVITIEGQKEIDVRGEKDKTIEIVFNR